MKLNSAIFKLHYSLLLLNIIEKQQIIQLGTIVDHRITLKQSNYVKSKTIRCVDGFAPCNSSRQRKR